MTDDHPLAGGTWAQAHVFCWPEGGNGGLIEARTVEDSGEVNAVPERETIVAAIEPVVTPLGLELFDVQFTTPHLQRLGAVEMPRPHYRRLLARALRPPGTDE